MKDYCYFDLTLETLAAAYMRRKNLPMTTGTLATVMKKILNKVDYINKNKKEKLIKFSNGVVRVDAVIFGQRTVTTDNGRVERRHQR